MPKTILIVDDEKDIIEMLKYNLEKENYRVLTASNGKRALEMADRNPDIILLDVMMPEMDGLEVCRALKKNKETADIPIVFLTARAGETDEIAGLEIGADDYLTKPISIKKLTARIKTALRKKDIAVSTNGGRENIFSIGGIIIDVLNYTVKINSKDIPFPRKEFETLLYLARHRDRVVSREALLNAVWGENIHVVDRTIDVHIRKIREKLGEHHELIQTIKGIGYRFKE